MNRRRKGRRRRVRAGLILVLAALSAGLFLMGAGQGGGVQATLAAVPPQTAAPVPTVPPTPDPEPEVPADDWRLTLANPWTPLPEGYEPALTRLKNGHAVDERCYPALQEMLDACRAAGLSPVICSSYRTQEKQEQLFQRQVDGLLARGYAPDAALSEAAKAVAAPGTSEHQLGLAVDIVDLNNQNLNESQEDTAVQKWLMEHCWEYGFILRYPNDKSAVTGIIYEPWHYRYVGQEAAGEIHTLGVCLEEYLAR